MKKIFIVILLFLVYNANAQDTLELYQACKMVDSNLLKVKNIKDKNLQKDSFLLCFNQFLAVVENNENSFSYNFDYLKTIKVCTSSDNKLRFFSSLLVDKDNNAEYFAKILKKNDNNQNVFVELPNNWYAAIYYQIANVGGKKTPVYVACGSQLGNDFVNRKVLEQFVFQGDKIVFGGNFIDEKKIRQERLIFEYNKHSAMTLFVDTKAKTVILDHLSPSNPKFKGNNMFYGSDFSFDGYYFNGQSWEYIPDIDYKQGK